jgi:hypothetical protein
MLKNPHNNVIIIYLSLELVSLIPQEILFKILPYLKTTTSDLQDGKLGL